MSPSSSPLEGKLTLHPEFTVGETDPRLFGSFVEHMGRAVYGGIFEPGHPQADEQGFRRDVLELVRELRVPIVRYPGGNFVSGYNWEDGIGPVEKRPRRLDLAWGSTETNRIGTDEFADWARKAGTEVMMAVNLGSRDMDAARTLVEYCNHPSGTRWSDLRIANGHREPHRFKVWCLGNEMDGLWQIGHKNAVDYAKAARAAGQAMKWIDPAIELVACGSSGNYMATFPAWEATVLEEVYDLVDHISLHLYFGQPAKDSPAAMTRGAFVAQSMRMEEFIRSVVATCDHIKTLKRSRKPMYLSFDEWNVWYHNKAPGTPERVWAEAPALIEDIYTFEDMILFCGMMLALLRNVDRVKMACLAQLVNVIAPIMTVPGGPAWRQTIYYPFLHASHFGRGTVLRTPVVSPVYETREGEVPFVDALAVLNREKTELTLFAINRSEDKPLVLRADLQAFVSPRIIEHLVVESDDPLASNTAKQPNLIVPHAKGKSEITGTMLKGILPPFSWNVIRVALPSAGG